MLCTGFCSLLLHMHNQTRNELKVYHTFTYFFVVVVMSVKEFLLQNCSVFFFFFHLNFAVTVFSINTLLIKVNPKVEWQMFYWGEKMKRLPQQAYYFGEKPICLVHTYSVGITVKRLEHHENGMSKNGTHWSGKYHGTCKNLTMYALFH